MNFENVFLEKLVYKEYKLYELLINSSENQFYTTSDLAKELGYSMNVMSRVIQNLNTRLIRHGYEHLIHVHRKSGLSVGKLSLSLGEMRAMLMKESLLYLFIDAIAFNQVSDVQEFCEEHYVSTSTLYRRMRPLLDFLETFQISISMSQGKFIGEEKKIRVFLFCMYWISVKGVYWPFHQVDEAFIQNEVKKAETISALKMNLITLNKTSYIYAISKLRAEKDAGVENEPRLDEICEENPLFHLSLFEELFTGLPQNKLKAEARSLFFILNFKAIHYEETAYLNSLIAYYEKQNNKTWRLANYLLEALKKEFPNQRIGLTEPTLLGNLLSLTLASYVFDGNYINLLTMSENAKIPDENHLSLFLDTFFSGLKGSEFHEFHVMKSYTLMCYYRLLEEVIEDIPEQEVIKIGMVLDANLLIHNRLKNFLERFPYPIKVYNLLEYQDSVDLIITNAYIETEKAPLNPQIYYWNPHDDLLNYINIMKLIYSEKKLKLNAS